MAFATIGAIEASLWISADRADQLSEAELFHCNGGSCDNGWNLAEGLDAAKTGLAPLSEAPWTEYRSCRSLAPVAIVKGCTEHRDINARKRAVARGPVVAGMKVYQDLGNYVGGTYRHVVGTFRGNHAIRVVGYDDAEQYWILRNSWGGGWALEGRALIAYGQCYIDELPFYSCTVGQVCAPNLLDEKSSVSDTSVAPGRSIGAIYKN